MLRLSLSRSFQLTGLFQFTVRLASETEARFTSVERIHHYVKVQNGPFSVNTHLLHSDCLPGQSCDLSAGTRINSRFTVCHDQCQTAWLDQHDYLIRFYFDTERNINHYILCDPFPVSIFVSVAFTGGSSTGKEQSASIGLASGGRGGVRQRGDEVQR